MGFPGPGQLIIVLLIVVVIFGAKRLRNVGGDLGSAVKGFKDAVKPNEDNEEQAGQIENTAERVVDEVKENKEV